MSAINDALKRARELQQQKNAASTPSESGAPTAVQVSKAGAPNWLWWVTLALFLIQTALYVDSLSGKRSAEEKLDQALLQLNDERAKTLDLLNEKSDFESRLSAMKQERDDAMSEMDALSKAKQDVEFDNIEKEKKVSEMTKQLHELSISQIQLTNEVKTLKAQLEKLPAPLVAAVSKAAEAETSPPPASPST